eukprot:COSAG06_NODE_468_length_15337_cov_84.949075_8_plen_137_part_00
MFDSWTTTAVANAEQHQRVIAYASLSVILLNLLGCPRGGWRVVSFCTAIAGVNRGSQGQRQKALGRKQARTFRQRMHQTFRSVDPLPMEGVVRKEIDSVPTELLRHHLCAHTHHALTVVRQFMQGTFLASDTRAAW